MMKRILVLLAALLMIANVSFAMSGFVDQQTLNGVHCGMSPDEVVAKWGKPISQADSTSFYFNPGGLKGDFYTNKKRVTFLRKIYAENNPQLVLKPSGVTMGMSEEEVIRRLGKPDHIQYMEWYSDASGMCHRLDYNMPDITNYAGIKGSQSISIWVGADNNSFENKVVAFWLRGEFY